MQMSKSVIGGNAAGIAETPFTPYNRLPNRLYNRFDNRLYRVNKHSTGCQTGLTTGLTTVLNLNEHYCSFNRLSNRVVQPVWQPAVYTIQPFVKPISQLVVSRIQTFYPVVKPVWQQQVVLCKRGLTCTRVPTRSSDPRDPDFRAFTSCAKRS